MLLADLRHDYVRSYHRPWREVDPAEAAGLVGELVAGGMEALAQEGVAPAQRAAVATAEMRYRGQHHEVAVSFAPEELTASGLPRIEEAFHRRHEQLYGFDSRERLVEVVALRVTARGRRSELALQRPGAEAAKAPPAPATRPAYLPSRGELAEVAVFDADRLAPGHRLEGPAILEGANTTVLVPEGFDLAVDDSASFLLTRSAVPLVGIADEKNSGTEGAA
jgi:N-methylhydantoinase A